MFNFDVNQILGMLGQQGGILGQQQQQSPTGPNSYVPNWSATRPNIGQFTQQAMAGAGINNRFLTPQTYQSPQRPAMNPMAFYRRPDFGGLFGGMQSQQPNVPTPGVKNDPSNPVVY